MKQFLLLLFVFVSSQALAQTPDTSQLQAMLDLDRFEAYTEAWAATMRGRGKAPMADAIQRLTAEDILALNLDATKFRDPQNYDGLILEILKKKNPEIKATASDVAWAYNFFKNKLAAAYVVSPLDAAEAPVAVDPSLAPSATSLPMTPLPAEEVLLDVGSYSSDRTTRGVFWEASRNQRQIELFVGSAGDFQNTMALRGTRVIAEVDTKARNYNPIYLVQDPGEKGYHYAITEISGGDRLRHFQLQSELVRWKKPDGTFTPPPALNVIGNPVAHLAEEERTLTQVLETIPRADHVVIGQKGAFERTFGSLGKIHAVIDMAGKDRKALEKILSADLLKVLDKAIAAGQDLTQFVMKYASDIDKMYEAATPLLTKNNLLAKPFTVFNYDRGSYEMSDYMMVGTDGKPQRWRIFSNVWGDEVLPIARALKATEYNHVNYMGTAGAFPDSGVAVGDLVMPATATDKNGVVYSITHDSDINPAGTKTVKSVMTVQSPFEETRDWLGRAKQGGQVVEVETGYLASVFNGPNDRLNVMLLISDVVGSEDETLASAASSSRRRAQINAISEVIGEAHVASSAAAPTEAAGVRKWISEIAPSRDPLSVLQVTREAQLRGITTRPALEAFIKTQKSFTTAKVAAALEGADLRMARLVKKLREAGIMPQMSVINTFLDGRFVPTSAIKIHLRAANAASQTQIEQLIQALKNSDPNFAKFVDIAVSVSSPGATYISVPGVLDETSPTLTALYQDGALRFGGLAPTENANGRLKFVRVSEPALSGELTTTAFFPPDAKTKQLMSALSGDPAKLESFLNQTITDYNTNSSTSNFELRLKKVPSIAGGSEAQIVPILDEDPRKLIIEMRITDEGIRNPIVVVEEVIHAGQIAGQSYGNVSAVFIHPYEWAETVANARAGSIRSIEKLTRMEVQAATAMSTFLDNNMGIFIAGTDPNAVHSVVAARLADAQSRYTPVAALAKEEIRKNEKAWERMRTTFDQLEKQGTKFNDLVMNNDRAGARRMLEQYLPWDLMEPSERNFWHESLEAMEHPNLENRQLVFRGMDDYPVLRQAGSDRIGMFSTVLTKNQGNYTRRLRSIATARSRFGVYQGYEYDPTGAKPIPNNPTLLVEMNNHAANPQGSPFISVSDNEIASRFGGRSRIALLIDERRMIPNAMAWGFDEKERLVPLVIFPDEVVYYHEQPKVTPAWNAPAMNNDNFKTDVEAILDRPIKDEEWVYNRATNDFLQDGYERIRPLLLDATKLPTINPPVCAVGSPCDCVYKTLDELLQ